MSLEDKDLLVVQIKSDFNKKYIGIGFDGYFYANEETYLTAKIFSFILLPDNQVLIRLHGSRFLTTDEDGYLRLDFSNKVPTIFKMINIEEDVYLLMTQNGNYLSIKSNNDVVIEKKGNIEESMKFKLRLVTYY